jgi:hypothetical protein
MLIPANIAATAMNLIMNGASTEDAVFMTAIESLGDCQDKPFAKAYGLANWAQLSQASKNAWDWVFGRENRLPGWAR